MKVVVAGGSGFIGRRLARRLVDRGDHVTILTRNPDRPAEEGLKWVAYGDGPFDADVVVNLAGENLFGKRWSQKQKAGMRKSRVDQTAALVARMASEPRPKVLVQASAIGLYGDRGDEMLDEASKPGAAGVFLTDVCRDWEMAARAANDYGVRVVILRIGVVLGPEGGAVKAMGTPFRFFAGGPVGSGRQWMSWVHAEDLVGLVLHCVDNEDTSGPINGAAPNPERMNAFCKALGRAMGRPSWLPVPGFVLRVLLGEVATVLLGSQRVLPKHAEVSGFVFRHPDLGEALKDLLGR